ncbi:hypothetical protein [Saccharothrix variisporea]|uniref:Uncharacterized protein n=1 Tax=Saccharothrix variisporea TaxID=543527 RepID=A0A495XKE4_9PSEU|nr:hypothetical protein [Saccharothrix variisporea]RKT75041.1 hypothetical protein DFJ66_8418 [Saccharothrix variisporea]
MTVPGSGALDPRQRELTARVHVMVTLEPGTLMVKALPPGALRSYLAGEVSQGVWGRQAPFDHRVVGGTVVRAQDVAELRTPVEFMRALRLDYPGSPFRPDLPALHVMEFPAVHPNKFVVPFGAPSLPDLGWTSDPVREAAYAMADAAAAAGVNPNTYRKQINPWPYSGTGITADPQLGVPEWWRRYDRVPGGSRIVEHRANGERVEVAVYQGEVFGWEPVR